MTHHQSHATESEAGGQFTQQQGGRQQGMQGGGQGSTTMSNTMPDYQWSALTGVAQAVAICEYCKAQCIVESDPMMTECIRLCEDVAELGTTTLSLVPQESRFQEQLVSAFEQAVQACAQECGQHEHAHCQQCAQVLTQTLDAISQLKQGGQQDQFGGQYQGSQQFQGGQQEQFGGGQQEQFGGGQQEQFGGGQQTGQFGGQQSQAGQYGQQGQFGQESSSREQFQQGGQQPGQFQ